MRTHRIRPLLAVLAVMVFAVGITACGDDSDSSSDSGSGSKSTTSSTGGLTVTKIYGPNDSKISVALEHPFIVELTATPSTGYEWTAVTIPAVQQETTEQIPGGSQPGAEGLQKITFRSQQVGTFTLTLNYARSFDPPTTPPAKTQTYQLTVTDD